MDGFCSVNKINKYTAMVMNYHVGKIIKGGSGAFRKIPILAHPNIKNEDAE
jgi:hypothetical protein